MKTDLLAAKRYAQALFEITKKLGCDEEVEAELQNLSSSLHASFEVRAFLFNPHIQSSVKRKFLEKLYPTGDKSYNKLLVDFISTLFEKNRFESIHEIADSFKVIADISQGQATATVRSAVVLNEDTQKSIVSRIEQLAGCKIELQKEVDPLLIGGVMVHVRNKVIDGTVRGKIDLLKKQLLASKKV